LAHRSGFIVKINPSALEVVVDEILENVSISEVADNLPESSPRYIAYRYHLAEEE